MFKTFINAFKIKDIRKKLLYTLLMLVIVRLGCQIAVPGIKSDAIRELFRSILNPENGGLGIFSAFTGGSLENLSIFALNITPYITSSIIMQLMTIAIPKLEEMQNDGEDGRKKIASITRYVTVALALIESGAMAIGFRQYLDNNNVLSIIVIIAAMTAGSAFLMWAGERITEYGVGNGISIVLIINIISSFPTDARTLIEQFVTAKDISVAVGVLNSVIIIAVILVLVVMVIYLSDATRKIPLQYAKKIQGNKMMGGNSTVIPIKINTAGVIPVIFASSILSFPNIISSMVGFKGTGWWQEALNYMNPGMWFNPSKWIYTLGVIAYVAMIVFFAYFYTSITFNPIEISTNLKKSGGFVPGIRPGKPTTEYLNSVLNYIIFIGAVGLTIVAVYPYVFCGLFSAKVSFGGTSIIIVVGVIVETVKQVESQMIVRNYKGFLNN